MSVLAVAVLLATAVKAQDYKMGLGIRFSSKAAAVNNSVTFKYFMNEQTAVETMLSFGDPLAIGLLLEKHKPLSGASFKFYYGGGGYVSFGGPRNVGFQGVAGLDYKFTSAPISLSLDWKPELNVWKEFSFEPAAVGLGARFTF